ncbi:MAG TPA: OsmC family protein [Solirubrobacterales bacterium]|nr:OsmC family protein [Solirubrobacterales bacterium]
MKVVARRREGYVHEVDIDAGAHRLLVDEPATVPGGTDAGPSPTRLLASALASCIAITLEMYAERKGWELGAVEVEVEVGYDGFVPASYATTIHLPAELSDEQRERLLVVAGKCPVHRAIAGHDREIDETMEIA